MTSISQVRDSYWPKYRRMDYAIVLFCVALIGIVWAVTLDRVNFERTETIANATKQNANLAIALEEQTIRTLKGVDQVLLFVRDQYLEHGLKLNIRRMLQGGMFDANIFVFISVIDKHGNLLFASDDFKPINAANRDYYKFHQQQDKDQMLVGKPEFGRVTGKWTIHMTRRINKPDGSFGGVVLAAVDPNYFTNFFQKVHLGEQGLVSLVGLDGITRVSLAGRVNDYEQDARNRIVLVEQSKSDVGSFFSVGQTGGVPRFISYRTLQEYPLIVMVGTSQGETLASFHQRERNYYLFAALVGIFGLLFVAGLMAALSRHERVQATLQESEERFRATFEQAAVGIAHATPDKRFLMVNQKFCDMLGYTREELLAMRTDKLPHPDDRGDYTDMKRLLAGEIDTYASDKRYIRKDGSILWVNRSVSLARDRDGKPLYFIRVVEDIAERKRAEEARAQLAAIVENSHDAIFSRTLDGIILSWNAGAERMLGYTAAEVIGKPIAVTLPPDRPPNLVRNNEALLRGEVVARESDRMTKDGRVINVLTSHSPITDGAGNIVGASIILQDISTIKQAHETQARLAAIVDGSNDAIVGRGLDRKISSWNAAAERLFGYTAAEIIGQSVSLIVPPEREQESVRNRALLAQGLAVRDLETERLAKDGRRVAVSISQFPINDEHGAVVGVATIFRDIGERKRAQETQARLAAIVDGSNDAIVGRSLDRKIVSWNAAAERMFGYTAGEVIGQSVSLIIPPDREQESARNRALLGQGRAVLDLETERLAKDGRRIHVSLSQSPIRDEHGAVTGVAIIFRDIRERKRTEAALRESETRYRSVIAAIAEGVILRDKNARIVACNASAERIVGRTLDQMKGNVSLESSWQAIREDGSPIPDDDRPAKAALRTGKLQSHVVQGLRKPDGSVLWLSMNAQPLFDESGTTPSGVVTTFTDITEHKQAELQQALEHTVTRLLSEAGGSSEIISKIIQTIGEAFGCAHGAYWSEDEQEQVMACAETWSVPSAEIMEFAALNRQFRHPLQLSGGLFMRVWRSGEPIWIDDVTQDVSFRRASYAAKAGLQGAFAFPVRSGNDTLGVMEFFSCASHPPSEMLLQSTRSIGRQIGLFIARKQTEERIHHLAHYDELTGLANRGMFNQQLTRALAQARRSGKPLAVLFIDLDRFKIINDTLGHEAGDRVLKQVAERLLGCLRASDTIGRLGGDEFVVLLEEVPQPLHVAVVAQKILAVVAKPYVLDAQEFHLTASIGISTYPADSDNIQSLLKNADIAMYRAKEQGKNNYQYYSAQMNVHSLERLGLESDLRRALEREEFLLHYQPKIDIASGRITGMEALVRWQHPTKGLVPPMQFIPLAEETGLIVPIGEWVLKTACARNKSWQELGLPPLRIAVNLSARQFARENLLQDVSRVLGETGLDPAALEFEITESMVMHDPEHAVTLLTRLKAMGIHLAIDDFGTGYSSLSYLKRFPLDSVKIDRSFIRNLPGDADDAAITRAIIAMAHSLRLKVIAEGVETGEQLSFLRDHGCDEMQGYYFSKPVPEHEFVRVVQAGSTSGSAFSIH